MEHKFKVKANPNVVPGQTRQIKIDRSLARRINCGKCGSYIFTQVYQVLFVPAVANPTGQDLLFEDGLLRCTGCGRARKLNEIEKKEDGGGQ